MSYLLERTACERIERYRADAANERLRSRGDGFRPALARSLRALADRLEPSPVSSGGLAAIAGERN